MYSANNVIWCIAHSLKSIRLYKCGAAIIASIKLFHNSAIVSFSTLHCIQRFTVRAVWKGHKITSRKSRFLYYINITLNKQYRATLTGWILKKQSLSSSKE